MNDYEKKLHELSQQVAFAKELLQDEWWQGLYGDMSRQRVIEEFIDDRMQKIGELVWGQLASQAAVEEQ